MFLISRMTRTGTCRLKYRCEVDNSDSRNSVYGNSVGDKRNALEDEFLHFKLEFRAGSGDLIVVWEYESTRVAISDSEHSNVGLLGLGQR